MRDISIPLARTKADFLPQSRKPLHSTARLQLAWPTPVSLPVGPSVAILLCIFHGKQFLEEQLESIAQQTHTNWKLYVSDDGDCDDSRRILERFSKRFEQGRVSVRKGPQKGFAANFLSLFCNPCIEADYYAFSDQDDVWDEKKLIAALSLLGEVPSEIPVLYCGRTLLVDEQNKEICLSPLFSRPPCFANALLQNIGGGNTMVFNRCARNLMAMAGSQLNVISHDWWTYMVVTGCGGKVFYDPVPYVRYRQHINNLVGANQGLSASLVRLKKVLHGRYRGWLDINMAALDTIKSRLTVENRIIFDSFSRARKKPYFIKVLAILSSGVHRQTVLGNIGVVVASLVNRI